MVVHFDASSSDLESKQVGAKIEPGFSGAQRMTVRKNDDPAIGMPTLNVFRLDLFALYASKSLCFT